MAGQLAERFRVAGVFTDAAEMLREGWGRCGAHHDAGPVALSLARACIEAGADVYLEKPFTVHAAEADELLLVAEPQGGG